TCAVRADLGSIRSERTSGDHLNTITTGSRGELYPPALNIKDSPVRHPLNHQLALSLGTRIGIGSCNRCQNRSDWTLKAETSSLRPLLSVLCGCESCGREDNVRQN